MIAAPHFFKFPLSCNAYLFCFRSNKYIVSMTVFKNCMRLKIDSSNVKHKHIS